jgi:hypothetical protein
MNIVMTKYYGLMAKRVRVLLFIYLFIYELSTTHGNKQSVSTDGGTWYPPQDCKFLKLEHHLHLHLRKALSKDYSMYKR